MRIEETCLRITKLGSDDSSGEQEDKMRRKLIENEKENNAKRNVEKDGKKNKMKNRTRIRKSSRKMVISKCWLRYRTRFYVCN